MALKTPSTRNRYFDLEGTPVRLRRGASSPEIYRGGGRWSVYHDWFRVMHSAAEIDLRRLRQIVAIWEETQKGRRIPAPKTIGRGHPEQSR